MDYHVIQWVAKDCPYKALPYIKSACRVCKAFTYCHT